MSTKPTPEFGELFRDYMVECLRNEHQTTVKVLAAVRDGDWKPDPKARTARELAWHLACSERWFLSSAAARKFEGGQDGPLPETLDAIRKYYDDGFNADLAKLSALSGEQMLEIADFYGMKMPLYVLLGFAQVHSIHHRAQLSTYLRPLGGKVPDIYGGSADEPWQG